MYDLGTTGQLRSVEKLNEKLTLLDASKAGVDLASIADGDEVAEEVTVPGAALGDFVMVSCSIDVTDLVVNGQVTAADTVTVVFANNTGGAINLGAMTIYVRVMKRT